MTNKKTWSVPTLNRLPAKSAEVGKSGKSTDGANSFKGKAS